MKKFLLIAVVFNIGLKEVCGQIRPIGIGDKVPDRVFKHVLNYSSDQINLKDLKGKLVLLDFWGPTCLACIKDFPRIDSLQKVFKDELQIVLINMDDADSTERFFAKRKKIMKPDVPMITTDSTLYYLFPHWGNPYQVWIDKDGTVLYTTAHEYSSVVNIQKVLKGEKINVKNYGMTKHPKNMFNTDLNNTIVQYSIITKCDDMVIPEEGAEPGKTFINYHGASVSELYKYAYDGMTGFKNNFLRRPGVTKLITGDTYPYEASKENFTDWLYQYGYNYQLCVPESKKDERFKIMKEDLDRYFDIKTVIQKRKVKCMILVKTGKTDKLKSKGGEVMDTWDQENTYKSTKTDSMTYFINQPFNKFSFMVISYIEYYNHIPCIDETGYKGNIDIIFEDKLIAFNSIASWKKVLRRYGLDLVERERWLDVLVIRPQSR